MLQAALEALRHKGMRHLPQLVCGAASMKLGTKSPDTMLGDECKVRDLG